MTDISPKLSLPYLMPAQAQKHITHNEALDLLDIVVQLTLTEIDAVSPPGAPVEGTAFALGSGAKDEWAGHDGEIAVFQNAGWVFVAPKDGWRATTVSGEPLVYLGDWKDARSTVVLNNLPGLGVGASADATNKLAVASPSTLLTHVGSGHQIKVNKANPTDTASLLYQSNWSGRAEIGLNGSDDFSIKVSPDGGNWVSALTADGTTGVVTLSGALCLPPGAEPTSPTAGMIYFDNTSAKLRCYDGTLWNDLF